MRGVVTLALRLLIPSDVEFRETLIFAAMVVTAGTLLLQGLTLPALVRALHLRGPDARPMLSRPQPFCRPPATPPSMSSTESGSPAIPTKR